MTRDELVKKSQEIQRRANLFLLPVIICPVVVAVFVIGLADPLKKMLSHRAANIIFIAGVIGMYVILFVAAGFAKRRRKRLECVCPQCKKDLSVPLIQLAIASGRCGKCGGIILEDWNK
jgi:uncharacterized membrane protein